PELEAAAVAEAARGLEGTQGLVAAARARQASAAPRPKRGAPERRRAGAPGRLARGRAAPGERAPRVDRLAERLDRAARVPSTRGPATRPTGMPRPCPRSATRAPR